jgi:O-antigen/teichoic acid export membrane protein
VTQKKDSAMGKFSASLFANIFNVSISTLTGLLIPKLMGATQYGYWQLYVLYITYIPYFHFGWVDGMYLREGGLPYDQLDKRGLSAQFRLYWLFDVLVAVGILALGYAFSGGERHVMRFAAIAAVILLPRLFFQYLLQASGRVKEYADNLVWERIICAVLQVIALSTGHRGYTAMIASDLVAKSVTLILILVTCKDIAFGTPGPTKKALAETGEDFRAGSKLTFSTISGMLLIGLLQFMVEIKWSIEVFGMVSFALVCVQGILAFLAQISVVLFPILKASDPDRYPLVFHRTGCYITSLCTFLLVLFFPLEVILQWMLPEYHTGILFLGIIVPMILFEGRNTLLLYTLLKTLRRETDMLVINIIMALAAVGLTYLSVFALHDLTLVVFSTLALLTLRCLLSDLYVQKRLSITAPGEMLCSLLTAAVFLVSCLVIKGWMGMAVYTGYAAGYGLLRKNAYHKARLFFHEAKTSSVV